jgi:hypothetical protein
MDVSADELAGVVDLFGALTRAELGHGLAELAFKQGEDCDPAAFDDDIDAALSTYQLVAVEADEPDDTDTTDEPLLVAGPVAFPELPPGATDLPHILDVENRDVDRDTAAEAAKGRFEREAATAVNEDDQGMIAALLDASYELEAWGGIDLAEARARLDDASE